MLSRRSVWVVSILVSLLALAACHNFFSKRDDNGGGGGGTGTTPKFAYVANAKGTTDSTISGYTVNASTGGLSLIAPTDLTILFDAKSLALDPSGSRLFALLGSGGVMPFAIDRTTGKLSDATGTGIPQSITDLEPSLAVVSLDGKFLLTLSVPTNELSVFPVGTAGVLETGTSYSLPTGGVPVGITLDSTGRLLYVADDTQGTAVYTMNASTGVLTSMPTVAANGQLSAKAVAITPNGKFAYISNGAAAGGVDMYAVNGNTGALSLMNGSPMTTGGSKPGALVVDPTGKYLYVANTGSGNVSEFSIGADGSLTAISGSPVTAGANPVSIAADPSGLFVYVANKDDGTVSIYKIGSNGALSSGGYVASASPNSVAVTK